MLVLTRRVGQDVDIGSSGSVSVVKIINPNAAQEFRKVVIRVEGMRQNNGLHALSKDQRLIFDEDPEQSVMVCEIKAEKAKLGFTFPEDIEIVRHDAVKKER